MNLHYKFILLFKKIARSSSKTTQLENIEQFNLDCEMYNLDVFASYMQENWFCETWLSSWTDYGRPGNREGLFNTNNASESFFKSLLHTFLLNKRRAPHVVIFIILKTSVTVNGKRIRCQEELCESFHKIQRKNSKKKQ